MKDKMPISWYVEGELPPEVLIERAYIIEVLSNTTVAETFICTEGLEWVSKYRIDGHLLELVQPLRITGSPAVVGDPQQMARNMRLCGEGPAYVALSAHGVGRTHRFTCKQAMCPVCERRRGWSRASHLADAVRHLKGFPYLVTLTLPGAAEVGQVPVLGDFELGAPGDRQVGQAVRGPGLARQVCRLAAAKQTLWGTSAGRRALARLFDAGVYRAEFGGDATFVLGGEGSVGALRWNPHLHLLVVAHQPLGLTAAGLALPDGAYGRWLHRRWCEPTGAVLQAQHAVPVDHTGVERVVAYPYKIPTLLPAQVVEMATTLAGKRRADVWGALRGSPNGVASGPTQLPLYASDGDALVLLTGGFLLRAAGRGEKHVLATTDRTGIGGWRKVSTSPRPSSV